MPTNLTNKFESQNQHHIFCCSILQHIRDKGISCKHYTIGNIIHLRGHLLRLNHRTHMVWEQCQTKMEIGSKAMLSRCETFFPFPVSVLVGGGGGGGGRMGCTNGATCLGCIAFIFPLASVASPYRHKAFPPAFSNFPFINLIMIFSFFFLA